MRRRLAALALAGAALAGAPAAAQSLEEIVAASFEHSPTLAAARAREDAAAAGLDQARAESMPSANVQGQLGWGHIDPQGFFGLSADDVTPRSAQVTLDLPIFAGGRIGAAQKQARLGRELAAMVTNSAALALRVEVVRAYTEALAADAEVRSLSKLEETLGEVVRQAGLRFEAGEGTSTEVAQAEARQAEAQAGLAAAQGRLDGAVARLSLLAGRPVTPGEDLPSPPPVPETVEHAVELALGGNLPLQQARKAAEIAGSGIGAARAEGLPTIGLYAEGASVRDQFFPGYKADSGSAGLRASWTFFSGGRTSSAVRKAEAEARAASADADAVALEIESQARQSFTQMRSARAALTAAEARVAATQDALRGTRVEVEVGAQPQLALLDAEREAIAAETARIEAAGRLAVAAHVLRAVTGLETQP